VSKVGHARQPSWRRPWPLNPLLGLCDGRNSNNHKKSPGRSRDHSDFFNSY